MALSNCVQCNEHSFNPILRGTFGNFRPPLLTTQPCVKSTCLLTITTNLLYRKCLYAFPKLRSFGVTFDNIQPLPFITSPCVNVYKLTITSDTRYREPSNVFPNCVQCNELPRNPSGILSVTFRPLSLTTSACVNLHIHLPLLRRRAIVNT